MMKIFHFSLLLLLICINISCIDKRKNAKPSPSQKPNILIILADDLGYSDLGCYGSEIQTPNIDNLADDGIRFTQMYNSARCCPSRASLLTGLYPHQAGMGKMAGDDHGLPGYAGRLKQNTVTIAEVLKSAGYRTFGSGKWHVNYPGPIERGFDEYYGFLEDYGIDGWEPKWMKRYPEGRKMREYQPGEFFATNAITDYAIDFLKLGEETPEKPWFMYVAYQAVHFPVQAPPKDTQKYLDTYKIGWDTIRQRRLRRMKELGVVDVNIALSDRSEIPGLGLENAKKNKVPGDGIHNPSWDLLDADRQADLAKRMAVYAGMVDNMDQNVGRLIRYLKETGQYENTLIMFLSDNGACGEWDTFGFEYPDLNARVTGNTLLNQNVLHKGENLDKLGGPDGPLFSYGSGWANVSNTPFSMYKMYTHEGGISTPFIIRGPGIMKESGTIFSSNYVHITDIMATCVDVANAKYPDKYNAHEITPYEGISLLKTLRGDVDDNRLLTFEHWGHPAIRLGDWKLVSKKQVLRKDGFREDEELELYNIKEDRSETNNLAATYPDKVSEMKEIMLSEYKRLFVFPSPNK